MLFILLFFVDLFMARTLIIALSYDTRYLTCYLV